MSPRRTRRTPDITYDVVTQLCCVPSVDVHYTVLTVVHYIYYRLGCIRMYTYQKRTPHITCVLIYVTQGEVIGIVLPKFMLL